MSQIIDIADAVTAELNATSFAVAFTAARLYQPFFELKEMGTLRVSVVPAELTITPLGRGSSQHDIEIDVAVQKKLAAASNAEIDALMNLAEAIADHFRHKLLPGHATAAWVATVNAPVFSQEHLERFRQFTSVIRFTFREQR